ncbi:fumarylacetoacetate hydrolase family protein [Ideonella livida]|uniref:Fumarylacetoacetate hydrolase family protein n=1 Tax=Ideonella livida TaxID=2707176 RepID=A0A7C9TK41_9BURK|nr:fumarylacetoacetate hydrolase family protein [Ideonella livida]NDY92441.1 fumarylacetoacetate hydrolase family protein [Ideonella livida]
MKLLSFVHQGQAGYGVLLNGEVADAGACLTLPSPGFAARFPDLGAVLAGQALPALAADVAGRAGSLPLAGLSLLPVLPRPGKIFCVGLNYKSHVAEMKRPDADRPAIFARFADSLGAHGAPLAYPGRSERFDFEGELAVVIGRGGRDIAEADAWDHIAGYACFNDGTARDYQRHTHQWTPGKNFPGTGAFGPALVTADEVGDVNSLTLTTRLNGAVMQQASLADLIFPLPFIVAYLSQFTPLSPGDVIATGTPGGVGDKREPPLYMQPGDVVEVSITRVGTLHNVVGPRA